MFSQKVIKEPNSFQFLEMNQKCDRMKKKNYSSSYYTHTVPYLESGLKSVFVPL